MVAWTETADNSDGILRATRDESDKTSVENGLAFVAVNREDFVTENENDDVERSCEVRQLFEGLNGRESDIESDESTKPASEVQHLPHWPHLHDRHVVRWRPLDVSPGTKP